MRKKIVFLSLLIIFLLAGCGTKKQETSKPKVIYGGVLVSEDGGKNFEPRSFIETTNKKQIKSLSFANVISLVIDPMNNDVMYVGTEKNGIFKTLNKGKSWKRLNFSPLYTPVMAIEPINTNVVYASAIFKGRGRLFKTENGGKEWKLVYSEPIANTSVTALAISPANPNIVFLGTDVTSRGYSTLSRSVNGGETWTNVVNGKTKISRISFDAKDPNIVYAYADKNEILRSNDGGDTWENLAKLTKKEKENIEQKIIKECKTEKNRYNCKNKKLKEIGDIMYKGVLYSFMSHPKAAGVLYVGTDKGLFVSRDYGISWKEVDIIASSKGLPIRGLAAAPEGYGMLYVAGKDVYVRPSKENEWAITDTKSSRDVVVAKYGLKNPKEIFLGLKTIVKKKKGLFGF